MIKCADFSPQVYKNSRDYQAFLTFLDTIVNLTKYEVDNMADLYEPMKCEHKVLPYLAEMVGYTYNITDSIKENRIIIDNFSKLLHYKGSELGIKLAACLSLNSVGKVEEIADLKFLEVLYDRENALIKIVYPRENTKVRNLVDYVRPVGMAVVLEGAMQESNNDRIAFTTDVEVTVRPYQSGVDSIDYAVELSEVSLGAISTVTTGGGGGEVEGNTWNELLVNQTTWNYVLENNIIWNSFLDESNT